MKTNKLLLAIILVFSSIHFGYAQVTDLGEPLSWNGKLPELKKAIKMPTVNVQEQLNIDAQNLANGIKIFRFGYEHSTNIDVFSEGEVFYTPAGKKVTRLGINCPSALSINLIFEKFQLSENTTLYFYSTDHSEYIGAYTSANNNAAKMLGTELINSDKSVIEIVEPKAEIGQSILNLGVVVHGYRSLNDLVAKALNSSGDCEYDVNCPIGSGWESQRNAVAVLINGSAFCTGSLVNNTSGSIIPYLLTANHCGGSGPASWVFRFRWESPAGQADCATSAPSVDGPTTMNVNGATLKANSVNSDFYLVELNSAPNPAWDIYYNGWDNSGNPVSSAVGIHHPNGDIKKISIENDPLTTTTWNATPPNSHWEVTHWDFGVTEPGSSGSPLFDENHRTIGQLHGGNSVCNGSDLSDEYGKFSMSWLGEGTDATQLKHWLDPSNTGTTAIDGVDPAASPYTLDASLTGLTGTFGRICSSVVTPMVTIRNLGTANLTQATITYNYGGADQIYNWSGNLAPYAVDVVTLPTMGLSDGTYTFTATVSAPNSGTDENATNDIATSSFTIITNATSATLTIHPDCYASETSWIIRDQNNVIVAQGGPYSDDMSPADIVEYACLPVACYNFEIYDEYGDGMSNTSGGCTQQNGSFELRDQNNAILCQLTQAQANFGDSLAIPFCVTAASLGVKENNLEKAFNLYPNPTNVDVKVAISVEGTKTIQVYSASGSLLYTATSDDMLVNVPFSNMDSGIYFVHVVTDIGSAIKKVVRQ